MVDTQLDTSAERNLAGYRAVNKYCDSHGIKVINATRGGNLEIFPRASLEEILKEK